MKIPTYKFTRTLCFALCALMIVDYWFEIVDPNLMFGIIFVLGAYFAIIEYNQKA